MIQISPNLIRTSSRRMSFDDIDNVRKETTRQTSMIEQMMSSSPETESSIVDSKEPSVEGRGSQQYQKQEPRTSEEKKVKTKTVKFGVSQKRKEAVAASAPSESLFSKETVQRKKEPTFGVGSLLAKGLLESGVLNSARTKSPRAGQSGTDESSDPPPPLQFETLPIGIGVQGGAGAGNGRDVSNPSHGLSFSSLGLVPSKSALTPVGMGEPLRIVPPPPPLPVERGVSGGTAPPTPKGFPLSSSMSPTAMLSLKVHIEGSSRGPVQLKIPVNLPCKVQEVIQMVIDQFHREKESQLPPSASTSTLDQSASSRALGGTAPKPESETIPKVRSSIPTGRGASSSISELKSEEEETLNLPSQAYELRMLDDDDGTPDMDMHPLESGRDIHKFGVNAVCLIRKQNYQDGTSGDSYMRFNTDAKIAASQKLNRIFIRVHMGNNEKYVIPATKDMTVADLFPLLVKKRVHVVSGEGKEMNPEEYNWFYTAKEGTEDEALETKLLLKDLEMDNLRLSHKIPQGAFRSHSTLDSSPIAILPIRPSVSAGGVTPAHFTFTKETAYAYSEYRVVKTNARGRKQKRIIGIDATRIWNKDEGSVRHPCRLISTVKACEVLTAEPNVFIIDYAGKEKSRREYRTETQVDCAEIVAKIQFLMKNPPKS